MASNHVVPTPPLQMVAKAVEEVGVGARFPRRHACDGTRHRRRGPVVGKEEQDRRKRPIPAPHQERSYRPSEALSGGRRRNADAWFDLRVLLDGSRPRPGHQTDQPVEEHRSRGAGESGGRSREDQAEALPEEPDPEGPEERQGERGSHGPAEQQSQPDGHLNEGKEGVPDGDMGPHEVAHVGDDPTDHIGLVLGVVQQVGRGEVVAEHVRLELQARVEKPKQP